MLRRRNNQSTRPMRKEAPQEREQPTNKSHIDQVTLYKPALTFTLGISSIVAKLPAAFHSSNLINLYLKKKKV
jgi:hypothetical protein